MSIGDAGGRGIWLIVLETEALEGFHIGRRLQKLGHHAQDAAKLIFHKMRVPAGHLLGEIDGQGFVQLMNLLPYERRLIVAPSAAAIE